MLAALAVFSALAAVQCRGFLSFLAANPSSWDGLSVLIFTTYAVLPLCAAAAFWSAGLGLGQRAAPSLGVRLDPVPAAALGFGLIAQAAFLCVWAGLPPRWMLALLAAAAFARPPRPSARLATPAEGAAAGLLAYALFCALAQAAAPPVEWDVRAYHLALPELYVNAGKLLDVPWMIHSHWPRLMETFYAVPLSFGSDGTAAFVHLGAAALLVAATGSWPAALLLAGQPALLARAGTAHADAAAALFVLGAAWCLARWEEDRRHGWLAAGGLLAGLAASAKLLGVAALAAFAARLVWKTRRPREAALFAGAGALMLGPWLWTTFAATGDPVWPFLRIGPEAASLAARYVRSNRWDFPPPLSFFAHDGPGFLVLPALGLLALSWKKRAKASGLESWLWTAAPAYAALAWRHNEAWRFLMPVWPALAMAGARGFDGAKGWRKHAAALLVLAGAAPIALQTPNNALFAVTGARPRDGGDRRAVFLERSVDTAGFYRVARAVLPPGAKVLMFRETRGYGAGFRYVWGDPKNQALVDYRRLSGPDELAARLKELGITHVLDHSGSHLYQEDPGYYDARTLGMLSALLAKRRAILVREGFGLYEL